MFLPLVLDRGEPHRGLHELSSMVDPLRFSNIVVKYPMDIPLYYSDRHDKILLSFDVIYL